jgi:prevent-host-death family protein
MQKVLSISEAKMKFNALIDQVISKEDEFILTKNGKPVATIVSSDVYEGWRETQEILADKEFVKEIRSGIRALKNKKTKRYTLEELFR